MRIRTVPLPAPDKSAKLKPGDFLAVLQAVPETCVLIGGQAVAWWAERYAIKAVIHGREQDVTSRDIDFWGSHADLVRTAARLKKTAALPNRHEMTLLVGAFAIEAGGCHSTVEMLHAVPGLDSANPSAVAVPAEVADGPKKRKLLVLSPVSLVLAKLHALRHFPQDDRQDLLHLRISLQTSKCFITETLLQDARLALWNCHRLIDARLQKPNRKLELKHDFRILDGVPLEAIRQEAQNPTRSPADCERLRKFLNLHWPRVIKRSAVGRDRTRLETEP